MAVPAPDVVLRHLSFSAFERPNGQFERNPGCAESLRISPVYPDDQAAFERSMVMAVKNWSRFVSLFEGLGRCL